MEVRNYDRNGIFIPDLSKIVLPDELGIALYRIFEGDARKKAEKD
ncbi:hypothetical protein P7H01_05445 [Enterococcus thailandicus]|nr:hypothetical protein [Enterococcus thailandicus]MDT2751501.1 hypothetical protein [Enterococcus thailandicus]